MTFPTQKDVRLNADQQEELAKILEVRLFAIFSTDRKDSDEGRIESARKALDLLTLIRRKDQEPCAAEWPFRHYTDMLNEFTARFCGHGVNTSDQKCLKCAEPKLDQKILVKPEEKVQFPFGLGDRAGIVKIIDGYFVQVEFESLFGNANPKLVLKNTVWVNKSRLNRDFQTLDAELALPFLKQILVKTCELCGSPLTNEITHYDHPSGWDVPGFVKKQWLTVKCTNDKCHHDWSINHLGVPQPKIDEKANLPFGLDVLQEE